MRWARGISDLDGLTVPTLVIGSERDRLTPISQSRRIARTAPNVVGLVELPGGHCSMLEQPHEVNRQLRALAESVTQARAGPAGSAHSRAVISAAARWPDLTAPSRYPVHSSAVSVPAQ